MKMNKDPLSALGSLCIYFIFKSDEKRSFRRISAGHDEDGTYIYINIIKIYKNYVVDIIIIMMTTMD